MNPVWQAIATHESPALLATVVRVVGSAYRREGAKMLLPQGEGRIGMLSGGCLEDDVQEQSRGLTAARVLTYDMRSDEDGLWGLNMGCNGLVDVLVEPVGEVLRAAAAEYVAGRDCTALVVLSPGPLQGRRMLLKADGTVLGSLGDADLESVALADAQDRGRRPRIYIYGETSVYIEPVTPPPVLWVVGAGADAPPLVKAAAAAGWRVRVVDRRARYADPARFPEAEAVLHIQPEELVARAGEGAFAVFMHHNFDHDRDFLTAMAATNARYLGVLGPLRRTQKILETQELPENVYAPIGLDLGGEGPEAIAVAVVAELQAVRFGRTGGHLRGKETPLHEDGDRP